MSARDLHDQGECGMWCPACAAEDERAAIEDAFEPCDSCPFVGCDDCQHAGGVT